MTYDSFKNDIAAYFGDIILKYNFTLEENLQRPGWFLLKNKKAILSFSFDRGEIDCSLKTKNADFVSIGTLFKKLSNNMHIPQKFDPWNPKHQLELHVYMIENSEINKMIDEKITDLSVSFF